MRLHLSCSPEDKVDEHSPAMSAESCLPVQCTNRLQIVAYLLVALCAFLSYVNVLQGEFVLDDVAFYVNNPGLTADHDISRFFYTSVWKHSILKRQSDPLYRPLFMTIMWINQTLFGGNVVAHHLFNVGMHLSATLMTLQLLRRLLPAAGLLPPVAGALLFAVHPVHAEAVSWIGAYGHILATTLLLVAMLCYLRHLESSALPWLVFSLTLFALALFSVEVAVAFPLILTGYEYLRYKKIHSGRAAAFWGLLVLYFIVRKLVLGQMAPLNISSLSAWSTALNFAAAYIEQLFMPWPQFVYLTTPAKGVASPAGGMLALALVVGVLVLIRRQVPERPVMLFSICWIVFALTAPILAALNAHPMFALRSLYLSSVGISIFTAWIFAITLPKYRLTAVVTFGLLVVLAVPTTLAANRDWLNNLVVYEKIFNINPTASEVAIKLANIYEDLGKAALAEGVLLKAVNYAPDSHSQAGIHERLGVLYGIQGDFAKSEQKFREVLKLFPEKSSAWVGLGNIALMRGDIRSALHNYLQAIELDPNNNEASYNVALAYQKLGDLQRAAEYLRRSQITDKLKP